MKDRLTALALSQDMSPVEGWFDKASFVLATRGQVESPTWCQEVQPSMFVRCVGSGTAAFRYPREFSDKQGDLPVNWAGGRNAKLDNVLWDILLALSQGGCVVVHCNQSFHRGPLGLMAVLRKLFGFKPRHTMEFIVANRIVYEAYQSEEIMVGFADILKVYDWTKSLVPWIPPPVKSAADDWGPQVMGKGKHKAWSQGGVYLQYLHMIFGSTESSSFVFGLHVFYIIFIAIFSIFIIIHSFISYHSHHHQHCYPFHHHRLSYFRRRAGLQFFQRAGGLFLGGCKDGGERWCGAGEGNAVSGLAAKFRGPLPVPRHDGESF